MPRVRCIARVRGADAKDPSADHAEACLVWFQDELCSPLAPEAEAGWRQLDRASIARDPFW